VKKGLVCLGVKKSILFREVRFVYLVWDGTGYSTVVSSSQAREIFLVWYGKWNGWMDEALSCQLQFLGREHPLCYAMRWSYI